MGTSVHEHIGACPVGVQIETQEVDCSCDVFVELRDGDQQLCGYKGLPSMKYCPTFLFGLGKSMLRLMALWSDSMWSVTLMPVMRLSDSPAIVQPPVAW